MYLAMVNRDMDIMEKLEYIMNSGKYVADFSRILIVEDDPDIREIVRIILTIRGYDVLSAEHGQQALELIKYPNQIKVILLDMRMPIMNGWQFAVEYRKMTKAFDAPIIVFTAAADAKARAQEIQANDYIAKPFKKKELLEKVEVYLRDS